MDTREQAAQFLFDLRARRQTVRGLPEALRPAGLSDAYAIQDRLVGLILGEDPGAKVCGYKVACTNARVQSQFAIDAPLFGQLLENRCAFSPASVPDEKLVTRCIESEFAFLIGADVPANVQQFSREEMGSFVEAALPAIEIVETHYSAWMEAGAAQLVADNAIHGWWVRGEAVRDWQRFDFPRHEVRLFANGTLVRQGSGANVLGDPFAVLCWLATELPKYGKRLKRGDFVTTGLTTEIFLASSGDVLRADFGVLGEVICTLQT